MRAEMARSKSSLGASSSPMSRTLAPGVASRTPSPSLNKTLPAKGKEAASPAPGDDGEDSIIAPLLKVIDKELTVERYKRLLGSAEFWPRRSEYRTPRT